jgi:hypothetical protein
VRAGVPVEADWESAATFVRANHRNRDLVTVAPSWADPLVRRYAQDMISVSDAGRSSLSRYERLWVFSIRGRRSSEAPDRDADFSRTFGLVKVERWDLGASTLVYDFVEHISEARVTSTEGGIARPCPWVDDRFAYGGGLGSGPMMPRQRFVCSRAISHLYVGATVFADHALGPRRCVWQHPQGTEPITAIFSNVPLGKRMVLSGGILYRHNLEGGAPVQIGIRLNGGVIATMTWNEGEGWKEIEAALESTSGPRGEVSLEVTADAPHFRSFCWAATMEGRER